MLYYNQALHLCHPGGKWHVIKNIMDSYLQPNELEYFIEILFVKLYVEDSLFLHITVILSLLQVGVHLK